MLSLKLDGADNVRDFGNTVNKDNRMIREKTYIRGNTLSNLSQSDVQLLSNQYKLTKIIDLRSPEEVAEKPDIAIPGAAWVHIPLFKGSAAGITREKKSDEKALPLDDLPEMEDLYAYMVTDEFCVSQIKEVFREILNHRSGGILWHCTAGKDRCGLVSALFLSLLDVDNDVIVEDYLRSNAANKEMEEVLYAQVLEHTGDKEKAEGVRRLFAADTAYLDAAFTAVNDRWGTVDDFLRDGLGISEEMKGELARRALL